MSWVPSRCGGRFSSLSQATGAAPLSRPGRSLENLRIAGTMKHPSARNWSGHLQGRAFRNARPGCFRSWAMRASLFGWLLCQAGTVAVMPLIHLDATTQPVGPLPVWPNPGALGGDFIPWMDVPEVIEVDGVRGVAFQGGTPGLQGTSYYGPNVPESMAGAMPAGPSKPGSGTPRRRTRRPSSRGAAEEDPTAPTAPSATGYTRSGVAWAVGVGPTWATATC